jgi:hypothetical protein
MLLATLTSRWSHARGGRHSAALLRTASDLLMELARRSAVVRREATCGIVADNLLTGLVVPI